MADMGVLYGYGVVVAYTRIIGHQESVVSLQCSRSIHQAEVGYGRSGRELKEDQCMPGLRRTIL